MGHSELTNRACDILLYEQHSFFPFIVDALKTTPS